MILFDAASDTVKRGETFVTDTMRVDAVKALSKLTDHPAAGTARAFADMPVSELLRILKGG